MSDGDQGPGALCHGPAAQFGDSVLGDDVIYVVLAGGHDGSGGQDRFDPADGSVHGRGRKGDKALSAFGLGGAANIVDLAAGTGNMSCTDGFGTYLSEEVYFQSSIDRDEVGMLRYNSRVIYGAQLPAVFSLRNFSFPCL